MNNVTQEQITAILKAAQGFNFWGKRLRDKQLEVVEKVINQLGLDKEKVNQSALCDWLIDHKPTKPKTERAKVEKPEPVELMAGNLQCKAEEMPILQGSGWIVTAAQNNTLPHAVFKQLEQFAADTDRELLILANHYSVPSPTGEKVKKAFNGDLKPYLVEDDTWLGCKLGVSIMPTADILPTAKQPVNSARQLAVNGSVANIVPSPKQQAETLPRFKGEYPTKALSTGYCTQYHYRAGRAGTEAQAAHQFGAWIVDYSEQDGFTFANIVADADSGCFLDPLDMDNTDSIVLGDLHSENLDPDFFAHTKRQLALFNPHTVVLHDVFDCLSRNGHNRHSAKFLYQMGDRAIVDDLRDLCSVLGSLDSLCNEIFVVRSNHDDMLDRWLDDNAYNPNQDWQNSKLYHFLKFAVIESMDSGDQDLTDNALRCLLTNELTPEVFDLDLPDSIEWGVLDTPKLIHGHDVAHHGHIGVNGSRGSTKLFAKLSSSLITGHTHSPTIQGDTVTVGVSSTFDMGYNKGGSSWDYANCHILHNGQRSLIWSIPSNSPLYS